jgi:hypothetical protein
MPVVPFWKGPLPAAPCTPPRQIFHVPFGTRSRPDADAVEEAARKRQRTMDVPVPLLPGSNATQTEVAAKTTPIATRTEVAAETLAKTPRGEVTVNKTTLSRAATPSWIHHILRLASSPTCTADDVRLAKVQRVRELDLLAIEVQHHMAKRFNLSGMAMARAHILLRNVLAKTQYAMVKNTGEDHVNTRLYALCAVTCVVISSKFEQGELFLPDVCQMHDVLPYPLLVSDIKHMELKILFLRGVQWNVHFWTRLDVVQAVLTGLDLHMKRIHVRLPVAFQNQAQELAFWSLHEPRLLQFSEAQIGVACLWCLDDEVSGPHVWNYLTVTCQDFLEERVTTMVKVFALENDLGGAA